MPVKAILENSKSLIESAYLLHRRRKFGAAVHISIAAVEEVAKGLVVFCREHLPAEVYQRRFNHIQKHRLADAPFFIAGALEVVFVLDEARKAGVLGGGPASEALITDLLTHSGWASPQRAAKALLNSLEAEEDPDREKATRAHAEQQESDRVASIYVDLNKDGLITSAPTKFDSVISRKYLEKAIVGLRVLSFVTSSKTPNPKEFNASLPRKWRRESQAKASGMIAQLAPKLEPNAV